MIRLRAIVEAAMAERRRAAHPLEGLTEEERLAVVRGQGMPRPPLAPVTFTEPSPVMPGRTGISRAAIAVFEKAQARGGEIDVREALSRRSRSGVPGVRAPEMEVWQVVDELVHFDLADVVQRSTLRLRPGLETTVIFDNGW